LSLEVVEVEVGGQVLYAGGLQIVTMEEQDVILLVRVVVAERKLQVVMAVRLGLELLLEDKQGHLDKEDKEAIGKQLLVVVAVVDFTEAVEVEMTVVVQVVTAAAAAVEVLHLFQPEVLVWPEVMLIMVM
jgi:hypothetical protein